MQIKFWVLLTSLIFISVFYAKGQEKVSVSAYKNTFDSSFTSIDTLKLSTETEQQYFGKQFGKGVLIAYQISTLLPNTISLKQFQVPFYGGLIADKSDLYSAKIKACLWNNITDSTKILPSLATKSSTSVEVVVSAEQIKWVNFSFTDTTSVQLNNAYIGLYFETSVDTANAVSPVFNESPLLFKPFYYKDFGADSTFRLDTLRFTHEEFWQNPSQIGGINGTILFTDKTVDNLPTKLESISKPIASLLIQSFPNPFNPSTSIQISGIQSGDVYIQILNVLGQVVHEKKMPFMNSTILTYKWNASELSSGLYFVKVINNKNLGLSTITLIK